MAYINVIEPQQAKGLLKNLYENIEVKQMPLLPIY